MIKQMKKFLLISTLCLILTVVLTGCGNTKTNSNQENQKMDNNSALDELAE